MRQSKWPPFIITLLALSLHGCTNSLLVKSAWDSNQIVIDGSDKDWDDTMFYIPNAQLTAGVRNDSSYLYLIFKTTNRVQSFQIIGSGLTVWFDPTGGTSERLGIHFPLGRIEGGEGMPQPTRTGESSGGGFNNSIDEQTSSFVDKMPAEVELLGFNENGPVRLTQAELKGIELQLNRDRNGLIYEMRVPLHKSADNPFAINPKGSLVGIQFVTGKFEPPSRGERMERRSDNEGNGNGEEMPGIGDYGGYGDIHGENGRNGGRLGSESQQRPKQMDFWLKVQLSPSAGR
jgi:hypothetical protein